MKRNELFKLIPVAAAVAALSLGMAGNAQADAYAYSYDNISNFQIQFLGGATPGTPAVTSAASASLNGSGVATGGAGQTDAPIAIGTGSVGVTALYNNVFRPIGAPGGAIGPYSYGDAQIIAQQTAAPCNTTTGAGCGHFANDAETHILTNGFSAAGGNNASGTTVVVPFAVGPTGATMTIQFDAEPYIEAFLASTSLSGSIAHADISASVEIDQIDVTTGAIVGTVFKWVPNGTAGDISGGTHSADPFSLQGVFDLSTPGHSTYNPSGAVFGATTGAGGLFAAATTAGVLPGIAGCDAGHPCYRLALSMTENVSAANRVPEPATLALLGIGLAGLGFGCRKKKA